MKKIDFITFQKNCKYNKTKFKPYCMNVDNDGCDDCTEEVCPPYNALEDVVEIVEEVEVETNVCGVCGVKFKVNADICVYRRKGVRVDVCSNCLDILSDGN